MGTTPAATVNGTPFAFSNASTVAYDPVKDAWEMKQPLPNHADADLGQSADVYNGSVYLFDPDETFILPALTTRRSVPSFLSPSSRTLAKKGSKALARLRGGSNTRIRLCRELAQLWAVRGIFKVTIKCLDFSHRDRAAPKQLLGQALYCAIELMWGDHLVNQTE